MADIPLIQIKEMFEGMRNEAGWNTNADLLWGYFFFHPDKERLDKLAEKLTTMDYRVVDIRLTNDGSSYVLHAERVETHTPRSLFERNGELNRLAVTYGVVYDGMDAGPVL